MQSTFRCFPIAAWAGCVAALAQAQGSGVLEEVVVTAQKREASLQDTPISISAFSSRDMEKLGVQNLADIQFNVPNLSMRQFPNSQSALRIFIRGIGNNDVQITQDPAVGIYVDGVYVARSSGLASQIVDPERIEVLRGPQGTLYGRNTTGGAINIIPKAPAGEFRLRQTVTVGNYDRFLSRTELDLPEVGGVSAKLGYIYSERDGWVENRGVGPNFGDEIKQGARLALRYQPADNVFVDYSFDHTDNEIGTFYYQTIGEPSAGFEEVPFSRHLIDEVIPSHPVENSDLRINGHSLIVTWDILPTLTIKSLTGYRDLDEHIYQDYSANSETPRLFANDPFDTRHRQFSQELQFIGDFFDRQLEFVAGLYYFEEAGSESTTDFIALAAETFSGPLPIPISEFADPVEEELQTRRTKAENEARAVFGQATWTPAFLAGRWHFTVGLRRTEDERFVEGDRQNGFWGTVIGGENFQNVSASEKYSNLSPAYTVSWDVLDNANVYAKYVKGYKTGGFSTRGISAQSLVTPLDEERVTTTEAGIKSQWLGNRLRFNAAWFDSDYEDIQLSFATQGNPADVVFFNAGKASISGFEADITAVLLRDLVLTVNYAMLDHDVEEVINPETGENEGDEYTLPSAPEESYTVDLTYQRPLGNLGALLANVNYSWRDSKWPAAKITETPDARIEAYGLLSARLGVVDVPLGNAGTFSVALWGKNLEDKEYQLDIIGAFPWSGRVGAFGEPRSYGLDVTYRF